MTSVIEIHKVSNDKYSLNGKRALVVGGTQGIGHGVAYVLAKRGASVVIAGRNEKLGEQVVSELNSISPSNAEFKFNRVDLADLANLKQFSSQLSRETFDYIVWTAGIFPTGARQETKDGIERAFAVNYLSKFVAFNMLLPTIKKGGRALIVNAPFVDALHGRFAGQFDIDDIETKQPGKWEERGLNLITIIPSISTDLMIKKLATKYPDILFFHQHPGYVVTDLLTNSSVGADTVSQIFGDLSKYPSKTPAEYGETAVYLLTDQGYATASGKGIDGDGNVHEENSFVKDPINVEKMWNYSLKVTGLDQ
jgi:NAD(P)-dependent dehydrogenase (short-subunit alcohol dehydrogenase family)